MGSDKTVQEIREWIMSRLYDTWMENTGSIWTFGIGKEEEGDPTNEELIRESRQLEHYGWVDIPSDGPGYVNVRLSPGGREAWETFSGLKGQGSSSVALDATLNQYIP